MGIRTRVFPIATLATLALAAGARAQSAHSESARVSTIRDDRYRWYFGASAGAMLFSTQAQTQSGIPAIGAHLAVVARRAGVMIGVEEAFGSDEPSRFIDPTSGDQQRAVTFDRIRRYGVNLTGYPVRGSLEPYMGVGFGLMQVENAQLSGEVFSSPAAAAESAQEANDRSGSAFMSLLAGVQFRVGRMAAFGQYQINTAPAAGMLLRGTGHMLMGGLRFSLGSAKEDIKGGGY
ncbi:MAG TPA: hypothetical protein VL241_02895 [Gemmatimonadales bacterium]|jgi:hypothetical protein|nr:hypothetical protein [Gemmatimonadales bacterium]